VLRVALGAAFAAGIAAAAWLAGSLSASGARAATLLGTVAALAGWRWALLLVAYFVSSSVLSRLGRATKQARTAGIIQKAGARDARQVWANGGVFGVAAVVAAGSVGTPALFAVLAGIGALSASAADTWATEIGTWRGGIPRSVRDWRPVAPGTSGAVTAWGTLGMCSGALGVSGLGVWLLQPRAITPVTATALLAVAGAAGAMIDTVLGAWWQSRRTCPACAVSTEQLVHTCGTPTVRSGGLNGIDNDVVNAVCTLVGALLAVGTAASLLSA
jgi:uncharacterized protein (TIGR00297 family)